MGSMFLSLAAVSPPGDGEGQAHSDSGCSAGKSAMKGMSSASCFLSASELGAKAALFWPPVKLGFL